MNSEYSYKSFMGVDLTDRSPEEFSNSEIIGSNFAQQTTDTVVFPVGVTGVTFIRCNLDNVVLPENSILNESVNRKLIDEDSHTYVYNGNDKTQKIEEYSKIAFWG